MPRRSMKTTAGWMIVAAVLWFFSPASAQEVTPEVFQTKTRQWLKEGDFHKIAMAIRFQREVGKLAFASVLERYRHVGRGADEEWLNAIARAFRMEGDDQPNSELRELGILWAETRWRGTLFEADQVVDTRGTVAQMLPREANLPTEPFAEALAATHLAVRVGNDQALPSMLKALKAYLEKNPRHPRKSEVLALEVSALEATGLWNEALNLGRSYASEVDGGQATVLHLTMLSAARKLERPTEVDAQLQVLRTLIVEDPQPLVRFIVESVEFARRCQSEEVDLSELTRRHTQVWSLLREEDLAGLPGGLGRQVVEAAGLWIFESLRRQRRETDEFPTKAQLSYIVTEDLRRLRRLGRSQLAMQFQPSETQAFLLLWNPEFMLATQALELEVVASVRSGGDTEQARRLLTEAGPQVQQTWETIREAGLGYQLAQYGNPIDLEGGQFEFVWSLGEAPRTVALQRLELARLYDDANALEEALVFQRDARSQGGFLGLEDARFLKVERLIRDSKAEPAADLNRELQELSAQNRYRPGQIVCTVNAAEIEHQGGSQKQALKLAAEAVAQIEEYLLEAGGQSGLRHRFRRAYELLAELQLRSGQGQEAFTTLARLGQAESVMGLEVERLAARDAKLAGMLEELEGARLRTRALEQARSNEAGAGRPAKEMEGELAKTRSDFYQTLGQIRRQYPNYGQMLAVRPVNFARLQEYVPHDTVVVQTFAAEDALFLFVLSKTDLKIHRVAVESKIISELSKRARDGLLKSRDRGLSRAGRVFGLPLEPETAESSLEPFVALYQYLVEPIAEDIEPYQVVAFIPSGALMDLPLQALAQRHGDSLRFLAESKQVVTILKSSDLERLGRQPSPFKSGSLIVGNPDGTLPGAAEEARAIAASWPDSEVLIGDEATLDQVRNLSGKGVLHLATHGVLDRNDPNQSYLVLGQGQQLNIAEIAGLDLRDVRLVTLSACETGLGVDSEGQSELTTLAEAFGFAGCPTVTASLWKVSDDSTKLLMEHFYRHLRAGETPAKALHEAQKLLIANKETHHPYHWASFLVIGDWR